MATPDEIRAQREGIQNSETLLDLSNQLIDSINERKKILKGINAEEQLYFATVKQQQKLSQDIAANAEKYLGYQIKSKDLAKQKKAIEDNIVKSNKAFTNSIAGQISLEAKLQDTRRKATKDARKTGQDIIKQKDELAASEARRGILETRKQLAIARGDQDSANYLQDRIKDEGITAKNKLSQIDSLQKQLDKQTKVFTSAKEILKNGEKSLKAQKEELKFLETNLKIRKQVEKSTGLLGGMAKAVSKIPGIGQYLNADEAINEMEELAAKMEEEGKNATSFGNRIKIAGKGLQVLAKGAYENLKSPEAVFTFFIKAALTANDQAVKLGKSLGYGAERADAFRENLAGIERTSNNLNVTTKNLVEAYGELAAATGFAYEFTEDQLVTQIKLTKQVGLTAEEAAQVQRFGVLNNKTSEETYKSFLKGITASRNQLKVGIDFKATLAEAVKVSGQLAAQLGNNPELIGKAIVNAKALGMTLEQVAKAGSSLLDFGTSISNELEAELLTGKQLNLERARAAALAGDQVTLAEELAKNMGTAADFTKLNKLQQDSLAKSVGMTSDELAETLRKREEAIASGKSLAQITEEEAKEALERQSIQDKFNAAVEKLQSLFGNLMAGPLGSFIDMLSGGLNIINSMITPLKIIGGIYLAHVATKKIALGYDIAMKAANQISANLGLAQIGTNRVKLMLEKESLLTRIAGNIQLFKQLVAEQGVMAALKIQFGLQQATNTVKQKSLLLTIREFITTKATAAWDAIRKTGLVAINALKAAGAIITKKDALFSIAGAAMGALKAAVSGVGALLGPLAIPLGIAAAAGVTALGYSLLKGDDVMSEGGYGKRTLLSPEGAIKLNDKDTVIAGTNLGGGKGEGPMPQIDLTPMIMAINEVRAAVDRLYSKDQSINMDGKKVGTTLVQNSYKVA
jgi:hypothetical protein